MQQYEGDGWRRLSRCRQLNISTEVFYDEDHPEVAKAICTQCPVRQSCRDAAIARNEEYGIWGGLTTIERDVRRNKRPPVKPEQHGTMTGYVGGCRDACCMTASQAYRARRAAEQRTVAAL